MKHAALLATLLAIVPSVAGGEASLLDRFRHEPTVRELQRAAERQAGVQPERVRSWLGRVRKAPLLPALKARTSRGLGAVEVIRGSDGIDRYVNTASDTWRFEVDASWALDRLVFDRNELRISREAQRVGARREELLTEVARLYYARRRLQVEALLEAASAAPVTDAEARRTEIIDRELEIAELTAVLDGLTGGALSGKGPP